MSEAEVTLEMLRGAVRDGSAADDQETYLAAFDDVVRRCVRAEAGIISVVYAQDDNGTIGEARTWIAEAKAHEAAFVQAAQARASAVLEVDEEPLADAAAWRTLITLRAILIAHPAPEGATGS